MEGGSHHRLGFSMLEELCSPQTCKLSDFMANWLSVFCAAGPLCTLFVQLSEMGNCLFPSSPPSFLQFCRPQVSSPYLLSHQPFHVLPGVDLPPFFPCLSLWMSVCKPKIGLTKWIWRIDRLLHFLLDYVYPQAQNRTYNWILKNLTGCTRVPVLIISWPIWGTVILWDSPVKFDS